MSSAFFAITSLCDELIEFLNYDTILSLEASKIVILSKANIQHLFTLYINQWAQRHAKYGLATGKCWDGWGIYEDSKLDLIVHKYAYSIIYPKYNLNSTSPKGTIQDVLFALLTDDNYDHYAGENVFDAACIKCQHLPEQNKWKFETMPEWKIYDNYIKFDPNHSLKKYNDENDYEYGEVLYKEEFYVFDADELNLLCQKLLLFKGYFDEDGIKRLKSLFGDIYNDFIDKWYLYVIEYNFRYECIAYPSWRFAIFGDINRSVLSKDFIDSYQEFECDDPAKFNDDTHVFIVFLIDLWIPHG